MTMTVGHMTGTWPAKPIRSLLGILAFLETLGILSLLLSGREVHIIFCTLIFTLLYYYHNPPAATRVNLWKLGHRQNSDQAIKFSYNILSSKKKANKKLPCWYPTFIHFCVVYSYKQTQFTDYVYTKVNDVVLYAVG